MVMNFAVFDTNLHMIHHYKRVNSAKSVVNTSAPKRYNHKQVSNFSSSFSTPTLLSTSDRTPSRASSNCEVQRTRVCARSCSVPPRPCTRRNLNLLPQHYITPGNPFPKINDNCNAKKIPIKNEPGTSRACKQNQSKKTSSGTFSKQSTLSDARKKGNSINSESSKNTKCCVKKNHDMCLKQCCCLNKPVTRRIPVPAPRIIKISSCEKPCMARDYEYLQFSLRITEDIIRNDLYSAKEMRRVFNSHIEANKGRLDMNKMLMQIDHLCKELNISQRTTVTGECICESSLENIVDSGSSSQNSLQSILKRIINGKYLISNDEIRKLAENDVQEVITKILSNSVGENDPEELNQNDNDDENKPIGNVNVIHSNANNFERSLSEDKFKEFCCDDTTCTNNEAVANDEKENEIFNDEIINVEEPVKKEDCCLNNYDAMKEMLKEALNKMEESKPHDSNSFNSNVEILKTILHDIMNNLSIQENCSGDGIEIASVCHTDCKLIEEKSVEDLLCMIQNVSQFYCKENLANTQAVTENEQTDLSNNTLKTHNDIPTCCDKSTEKSEVSIVEPKTPVVNSENKPVTFTDKYIQTSIIEDFNNKLCGTDKNCQKDLYCCTVVKDVACECGEQYISTEKTVYEVDNKVNEVEKKEREEFINSITNYILERTLTTIDTKQPSLQESQNEIQEGKCQKCVKKPPPVEHEKETSDFVPSNKSSKKSCLKEQQIKKIEQSPAEKSGRTRTQSAKSKKETNSSSTCCNKALKKSEMKQSLKEPQINNEVKEIEEYSTENSDEIILQPITSKKGVYDFVPCNISSRLCQLDMETIRKSEELNNNKIEPAGKCEDACTYKQAKQMHNNKSEFVTKIENIVTASNKNLYQFPESCENSHFLIPVCLKSLDNYETEYSKNYNKVPKKYKSTKPNCISKSDDTSSEGEISKSSEDSGCCKKLNNKVIKREQPEILERLKKYERNVKNSNKGTPCVCDFEIQNCDEGSNYNFFSPRFSRSKFFPTISTQTSTSNLNNSSGYHENLLSDGEIPNTSTEHTDTSGYNV